jgi:hypothetical protein
MRYLRSKPQVVGMDGGITHRRADRARRTELSGPMSNPFVSGCQSVEIVVQETCKVTGTGPLFGQSPALANMCCPKTWTRPLSSRLRVPLIPARLSGHQALL